MELEEHHPVIYTELSEVNEECKKLLQKYEIPHAEYYFKYSRPHNRMVMVLPDFKSGRALDERNPKWLHEGEVPQHIFGLDYSKKSVCIVEDPFSALKTARFTPSYCLFGTKLSIPAMKSLARQFKHAIIWLDYDAHDKAQGLARFIRLMGMSASVFRTEKDPKDQSLDDLKSLLEVGYVQN